MLSNRGMLQAVYYKLTPGGRLHDDDVCVYPFRGGYQTEHL